MDKCQTFTFGLCRQCWVLRMRVWSRSSTSVFLLVPGCWGGSSGLLFSFTTELKCGRPDKKFTYSAASSACMSSTAISTGTM